MILKSSYLLYAWRWQTSVISTQAAFVRVYIETSEYKHLLSLGDEEVVVVGTERKGEIL